jgi:hypothetical protein
MGGITPGPTSNLPRPSSTSIGQLGGAAQPLPPAMHCIRGVGPQSLAPRLLSLATNTPAIPFRRILDKP